MSVDPFKLIENGLEIFPVEVLNPGTDHKQVKPLCKWKDDASSDPSVVSEWIAKLGNRITDWGIPTGHRNGVAVLDFDTHEAVEWFESMWLPDGKRVDTPRGGTHVFYSLDDVDVDIQSNAGVVREGLDIRGEGGFVVAYTDDMADVPNMPAAVIEMLPKRDDYIESFDNVNLPVATELTPQEQRVLKGLVDMLDALPRPWREGAGYHSTQFTVACALNRIANADYYMTTRDEAHALFIQHAPLREDDSDDHKKRQRRWEDAVKITEGQFFEPPSDVPVRLDAEEVLQRRTNSIIDRLYWESKSIGDVRELVRELREIGASEQEAYSVSFTCSAMRKMRSRNPEHGKSTWGIVKEAYAETSDIEAQPVKRPSDSGKMSLLTEDEAALVRDYPNFIDRYIMAAKTVLAEPNMPLHYVNAWIALSCIVGDRADIHLTRGRVPLSLWALPLAESAAGKGDAKGVMKDVINAGRRGGFADVNAGASASAEALADFISGREGKVTFFSKDESSSLLLNMHRDGGYEQKMITYALDLYDGEASQNLRVGNAAKGVGGGVKTTFNMWMQTTWQGAVDALEPKDIGTGFIGRFLIAIGDDPKITDESLRPDFASEYQVQLGGIHPIIKSLGDAINAVLGRTRGLSMSADADVQDRYVEMRKQVLAHIAGHSQASSLRGVMLRVTDNMLKGAALLALSEGRKKIEMPDLLLAIKSGQYWVRDAMRLVEAISTSEYRKRIDELVRFCITAPRTRAQILRHFQNLSNREVFEVLERAEQEGSIKKSADDKKWVANVE